MTTLYVKITPEGNVSTVEVNDYRDIQRHVGGLITSVPIRNDEIIPEYSGVYANDEGLLIGLEPNALAQTITGYPYLVGNIMIGGEIDDEGNVLSVLPDTIAKIHEIARAELAGRGVA